MPTHELSNVRSVALGLALGLGLVGPCSRHGRVAGVVDIMFYDSWLVDELGSDARALTVNLSPGAAGPFPEGERVDLALTPLGGEIPTAELSALDVDTVDTLVHNKLMLQVRAMQQALPHLAEDGRIVLFSGQLARHPAEGYAAMSAVNTRLRRIMSKSFPVPRDRGRESILAHPPVVVPGAPGAPPAHLPLL